jgi:hypothetical protein
MDTTDVDSNAHSAQERFISHLFERSLERVFSSGSAVRVPSNMSIWPPVALFDAVYASAVLYHFGFSVTDILEKWGDCSTLLGLRRRRTQITGADVIKLMLIKRIPVGRMQLDSDATRSVTGGAATAMPLTPMIWS